MRATRDLVWDGCLNVRDLGGLPTEDGGETRFGAVVRADSVRRLSDEGWRALEEYGVRTVVDLRSHGELADDPPRDVHVAVRHVPVMAEHGDPVWQEIDAAAERADGSAGRLEVFYSEALRRWADRYAEAVTAVADAPAGAVVVHCHGGRDRTGIVAAFLLRLAGVPAEAVAEDYALSSSRLEPHWRAWVDEAGDDEERGRRLDWTETPAETMARIVAAVEGEHGSVAVFLRASGAAQAALDRARARLRG